MGDTKAPESARPAHQSRTAERVRPAAPDADWMSAAHDQLGNAQLSRLLRSRIIQPKLVVSRPSDPDEREAEAAADAVMSPSSRPVTVSRSVASAVHRTTQPPLDGPRGTAAIESSLDGLRGGGRPLAPAARASLEPRFGQDFSAVRLHQGSEPARLNRALGARAFTVGQDIFLGEGNTDVESSAGQHLLAHELTHTIQQGAGGGHVSRQVSREEEAPGEAARPVVVQRAPPTPPPDPPPAPPPASPSAPPAAAATPGAAPPAAPAVAATDNDPVDLPVSGDLTFTVSSGMSVPLGLPDLKEFGIGKGTLTTEPIEIAEGVEASVEIV